MIFFLLCFIEYLNVFPKRFICSNTPRMENRMYANQIILFCNFVYWVEYLSCILILIAFRELIL